MDSKKSGSIPLNKAPMIKPRGRLRTIRPLLKRGGVPEAEIRLLESLLLEALSARTQGSSRQVPGSRAPEVQAPPALRVPAPSPARSARSFSVTQLRERVAVVGLGYVGLPVALAFAHKFGSVVGFDVNSGKVSELQNGQDRMGMLSSEELLSAPLTLTDQSSDLAAATFFVVAVPTPIDQDRKPDLTPLVRASETIGRVLRPGAVVVYESTVYPGVTEEVCGPVLERASGLKRGVDFKLGYSPERINPGDKEHSFERVVKVVAGEDEETLERVAAVYEAVVPAGVHRAASIKVAEAAKVIENTQRDLNIGLMNELALIFDRLGIATREVLEAAATKWNFLPFKPGLVGGHCIGVDPYYLIAKAEASGYYPEVIRAGRRANDKLPGFIARKLVALLSEAGVATGAAKVGILGVTFKEDVTDTRNSRVPDIAAELKRFGVTPLLHDPLADAGAVMGEYGLKLSSWERFTELDALMLAVPHHSYLSLPAATLFAPQKPGCVVLDVKAALRPSDLPAGMTYWSL